MGFERSLSRLRRFWGENFQISQDIDKHARFFHHQQTIHAQEEGQTGMCGRFATGDISWKEYTDWLEGNHPLPRTKLNPSWNVKPTQEALILRLDGDGMRELAPARWWLVPRFFRKPLKEWKATTFNARIEGAATSASFRASWKDRRCLVPVIGWYEWTGPRGQKIPWYFHIETNAPGSCFAGLWDRCTLPDDTVLDSFTILTTEPNEVAGAYHTRMPVIVDPAEYEVWLTGETNAPQEVSAERLCVHRVAPIPAVADGPELIELFEPNEPDDEIGGLFGGTF